MTERRVFTYKDVEEAKGWIGKGGVFSDSLESLEQGLPGLHCGILDIVSVQSYHFKSKGNTAHWQFFSPNPEPIEKWVPFTAEDFKLILGKPFRKKSWEDAFAIVIGVHHEGVLFIYPATNDFGQVGFGNMLNDYEFADGTPYGKKVTE